MKKILAWLLVLMLLTAPVTSFAEQTPEESPEPADDAAQTEETLEDEKEEEDEEEIILEPLKYDYAELVVGTTMPLNGKFFTSMWGNNSSDIDVRQMIHGYNLVEWDSERSGFVFDPSVVSGHVTVENAAGDHIFTISIYNNLYYSDGTRITAWDYAFAYLLRISPLIREIGRASCRERV